MAATKPKTASRAHLSPIASVAPAAPISRAAATFRERDAQLQLRADVIKRELEPALGYRGMGLTDWEIDGYARALASESITAQDAVLRLVALRMHLEEVALGDPDAVSDLIAEDGHGSEPVF